MLEDIHGKDHVELTVLSRSQFFGTERQICKIVDIEPISKQEADLRVLVEPTAAGLDGYNLNALSMKNERDNSNPGTDLKDALPCKIYSFQKR